MIIIGYLQLLLSRPLDALSAKKLNTIQTNFQYIENSVRVIDEKLDAEWDECVRRSKKNRSVSMQWEMLFCEFLLLEVVHL